MTDRLTPEGVDSTATPNDDPFRDDELLRDDDQGWSTPGRISATDPRQSASAGCTLRMTSVDQSNVT